MIKAASMTVRQLPEPPFRRVLLRSLGATVLLFGLFWLLGYVLWPSEGFTGWQWLDSSIDYLAGAAGILLTGFLLLPIAGLFIGIFIDEISAAVEGRYYAHDPAGRDQPIKEAVVMGIKFATVLLVVNILLLPFYFFLPLVPWLANAYLIGREYFEMVAVRHHSFEETTRLRHQYRWQVYFAGILIAGLLMIPILNFAVPLVGAAFMVHWYKYLTGSVAQDAKQASA